MPGGLANARDSVAVAHERLETVSTHEDGGGVAGGAYIEHLSNEGLLERGALYQALNLTGATGVALVCWYRRTWQAFWIEAAWAAIALKALL